ncbi:MAG: leucine-rich repeat protein [Clostridia bacterium]|nr:leucine-rich repeat protein [Clostridia bacterium]
MREAADFFQKKIDYKIPQVESELGIIVEESSGYLVVGNQIAPNGGEGFVCEILDGSLPNSTDYVVKIFHDDQKANVKKEKIRYMLTRPYILMLPRQVCWPCAELYYNNKFIGILIKRVKGDSLKKLIEKSTYQSFFPVYDKKYVVDICISLIYSMQKLHAHNVYIGDINPDNFIVVRTKGVYEAYFIDTDSFALDKYMDNLVGLDEYYSPERLCDNIINSTSEGYSMCLLIFRLLMPGVFPFASSIYNNTKTLRERVIKGLFTYYPDPEMEVLSRKHHSPDKIKMWNELSSQLKNYFYEIFTREKEYNGSAVLVGHLKTYWTQCADATNPLLNNQPKQIEYTKEETFLPEVIRDDHIAFGDQGNKEESYLVDSDINCETDHTVQLDTHESEQEEKIIIYSEGLDIESGVLKGKGTCKDKVIRIPNTITNIGQRAFANCNDFTEVVIPRSVIRIEESAFRGCRNLKKVSISKGLIRICSAAFYECVSLQSIEFPNSLMTIEESVFAECAELAKVVIPNSVVDIGKMAFSGCAKLNDITISDSLVSIESSTFSRCRSLKNVVLPDGLKKIHSFAFCDCENLASITIPDSVENIEAWAFSGCIKLQQASFSEKTKVDKTAFNECPLNGRIDVKIDDDTKYSRGLDIKDDVLCGIGSCMDTDIIIPTNVISIKEQAFFCCKKINSVIIPKNVKNIEKSAFNGCANLRNVVLSDGIKSLGPNSFCDCIKLKSITIPKTVINIGKNAFINCDSLVDIIIPEHLITSSEDADFNDKLLFLKNVFGTVNKKNRKININGKSINIGDNSLSKKNVKIPIVQNNSHSETSSSILWSDKIMGELRGNGTLIIPNGTKVINSSAYYGRVSIIKVVIPGSVTSIGDYAFYGCTNLRSITIPESVTYIGDKAFFGCSKLTSIQIPFNVKYVGNEAFGNCYATTVAIQNSHLSFGTTTFTSCAKVVYSKQKVQNTTNKKGKKKKKNNKK